MIKLLTSTYFKYLIIPLVTTFLVIFVKSASRRDKQPFLEKEDFSFGLEMGITAVLLLFMNSVNIAQQVVLDNSLTVVATEKILTLFLVTIFLMFGLWGMSTIVRKLGWENDKELKIFWGIVLPDVFGLLILIYAVSTIGNEIL